MARPLTFDVLKGRTEQHFVHVSPHDDRRMVAVLPYHLLFHKKTATGELVRFGYGVDDGYLHRTQYAERVKEVHHERVLRIMAHA